MKERHVIPDIKNQGFMISLVRIPILSALGRARIGVDWNAHGTCDLFE